MEIPNNIIQIPPRLLKFSVKGDERGKLIAIENSIDIPFDIKRIYYIYGNSLNLSRGFHAHKNLQQVLIAISGSVKIKTEYQDKKDLFILNTPNQGLLISGLVWREMFDFTDDCVLEVLASDFFKESDYIRNYEQFKEIDREFINVY